MQESIHSKGGKARADKLTPEERNTIAVKAAQARWSAPLAECEGEIKIGEDISIPCYVLDDGSRVLSSRAFQNVTGLTDKDDKTASGGRLVRLTQSSWFNDISDNELISGLNNPIKFLHKGKTVFGYTAEILTKLCQIIVKANAHGLLKTDMQMRLARHASSLLAAFANIGLIALIDEATGYQDIRAQNALAKILEQYIATDLMPWTATFPLEFYKHIFRLRNWEFDPQTVRRPAVIGKWTNDFVYSRLAPGVLDELKERNPSINGRRKNKHFQWLSGNVGHPRLKSHLDGLIAIMRISDSWDDFKKNADKAFPVLQEIKNTPLETKQLQE